MAASNILSGAVFPKKTKIGIDGTGNNHILDGLVAKMTKNQYEIFLGVPHVVLLTKIDEVCPYVAEDTKNVFQSHDVYTAVNKTADVLGLPQTQVLPIRNYENATELDCNTDILALTSLRHMLRMADDYFDEQLDTNTVSDD